MHDQKNIFDNKAQDYYDVMSEMFSETKQLRDSDDIKLTSNFGKGRKMM